MRMFFYYFFGQLLFIITIFTSQLRSFQSFLSVFEQAYQQGCIERPDSASSFPGAILCDDLFNLQKELDKQYSIKAKESLQEFWSKLSSYFGNQNLDDRWFRAGREILISNWEQILFWTARLPFDTRYSIEGFKETEEAYVVIIDSIKDLNSYNSLDHPVEELLHEMAGIYIRAFVLNLPPSKDKFESQTDALTPSYLLTALRICNAKFENLKGVPQYITSRFRD